MWVVQFQARCTDVRSDLSPLAARDAALSVESALSVALLALCSHVAVEAVTVELVAAAADEGREQQACLRLVHAAASAREQAPDDAR